jgi:hypothetical protein
MARTLRHAGLSTSHRGDLAAYLGHEGGVNTSDPEAVSVEEDRLWTAGDCDLAAGRAVSGAYPPYGIVELHRYPDISPIQGYAPWRVANGEGPEDRAIARA